MTDPSQYFKGRTVQEQMNEVIGYVDVRSAEVATDAIASDVAQVHSDAADAHADALAAAASAAAAAGTLTNAVKKTGEASQSIDGDIDLNDDLNVDGDVTVGGALAVTGAVTVPTPVNNTDAASKKYVDDADALKISISDINSYAVGLTGNQVFTGNKTNYGTVSMGTIQGETRIIANIADNTKFVKIFEGNPASQYTEGLLYVTINRGTGTTGRINNRGLLSYSINKNDTSSLVWLIKGSPVILTDYVITRETDVVTIWAKSNGNTSDTKHIMKMSEIASNTITNIMLASPDNNYYAITNAGYTDGDGVVHTFIAYNESTSLVE